MLNKKFWGSLGIIALLSGVGIFLYSVISSPEMKLAKAVGSLLEEEKVQVETDYEVSVEFDGSPEALDVMEGEEVFFDIFTDLMKNIQGENSVIIDFQEEIIEMVGSYGIDGDIYGEEISLQFPLSFYVDEDSDEFAIDLDPYGSFIPEFIDIFAYHIIPNIPEIEQEFSTFLDGEDMSDWISTEMNTIVKPVLEQALEGKKFVEPLDIDEKIFKEDEHEDYLFEFILEKMLTYIKDQNEGDIVTEEDGWIYLNLDEKIITHALLYALEEVNENEEAKETFEKDSDETVEMAIQDLEDSMEELEDMSLLANVGYKIENGNIVEDHVDLTFSFEEDGVNIMVTATAESTYLYNDDIEFSFYGQGREALTEAELDQLMFDIEMEMNVRMEELFYELEGDYYDSPEYDYELTEEELELITLIENKDVSHEDFELTEEEMYFWVLELELEGLVEPGTSDLYFE